MAIKLETTVAELIAYARSIQAYDRQTLQVVLALPGGERAMLVVSPSRASALSLQQVLVESDHRTDPRSDPSRIDAALES